MSRVVGLAKLASVLLLTTAFAACERSTTTPTAPTPRLGVADNGQELAAPSHLGGKVSGSIGARGGELHFDDYSARGIEYWLDVPAGAVSGSTAFSMKVNGGRNFRVDLSATADGVDVGARGFARPVRLTISYAAARVPSPSRLRIVWLPDDGSAPVPVITHVDPNHRTVTGYLPHFSHWTVWY